MPAAAQNRPRPDGRPARESAPVARDNGPRQSAPQAVAPRQETRSAGPREEARPQVAPRDYGRPQAMPRSSAPAPNYRDYRSEQRRDDHRGASPDRGRSYGPSRGYGPPRGYVGPRGYAGPRYTPRAYHYYSTPYYRYYGAPYRPYYFGRPYYTFRPRVSLGFGLWIGFGVPYPYSWVSYAPPVYGYYQGGVRVVPGARSYGGVSFDISPRDAAIILDGTFVGYAGDFGPNATPLTVTPGPHRIEVQAEGYDPMSWDVDIVPGQVIPFRGDMQPY